MNTTEIKTQITKVLDNVPEDVLESVLDYLKSVINNSRDNIALSGNLRKILEEDKELLQKLAQ